MDENARDPQGFDVFVGKIGIKDGDYDSDITVIRSSVPNTVACGMYTQSHFPGHSVPLSREVTNSGTAQGVVVISKNANVANGDIGDRDAAELQNLAAELAGVPTSSMAIASTGVIGRPYPMDTIRNFFAKTTWPETSYSLDDAATAIMTTDTHPKVARAQAGSAHITGIAKGVGMIEPDMATMLTYVCTDAAVSAQNLAEIFGRVVQRTFNSVSVDTDTSTSDSAVIFANGLSGEVDLEDFEAALLEVCLDLTRKIASDGEGATKRIEVTVNGARDDEQARRVGKAIVNSPLVKTAVHGADPNWGRIIMAIGKCKDDRDIDQNKVRVHLGEITVYPQSQDSDVALNVLAESEKYMRNDVVEIKVDLGIASSSWRVYGCDLSREYIAINADYTT